MTTYTEAGTAALADLTERQAVRRLVEGDHTLWRDDPTELADRLGWIPVVQEVLDDLPALTERCDRLVDGVDDVLLMGMGGSSLFPEVLTRTFEPAAGRPRLHVLDTTDPAAVARLAVTCPPERTLHVAASKSGSTIETRSHLEWAWMRAGGDAPFAVITDPRSELGGIAHDRGFLEVFENRSDIGGRYSALSLFGVVPALLMGLDVGALLRGGLAALADSGPDVDPAGNPALQLAAAMAAGVRIGRDKLTVVLTPEVATAGLWLEQLLAESLGKDGTGVVPVVGEPVGAPDVYGDDRLFVSTEPLDELAAAGHPVVPIGLTADAHSLGHFVMSWELATALAGAALGVQPFDQPDVAAAKAATNEVLESGDASVTDVALASLLDQVQPGDHLALQAFVDPGSAAAEQIEAARVVLRDRHRVATSLGFGPRFLHSTGQLHKGGPDAIVCAQVVGDDPEEVDIPGRDFGFGHLKQAQATGDLRTLQERNVRAGRVALAELVALLHDGEVTA
ncbi:MAG: glucose-6-phosphate isomerase [Acidimicrobiales bacterium]